MLNKCHLLEFSAIWPYRLSVRSSGFHPGKSGSIPGGATEQVLEIGYGFLNWAEGLGCPWSPAMIMDYGVMVTQLFLVQSF